MTDKKAFKRLVRARAERLGTSYSTALRHFRDQDPMEDHVRSLAIAAPPDLVWRALEPPRMRQWRKGWNPALPGDPGFAYTRVQERYRRLGWAFGPATNRSEVDVDLIPDGDATRVVVTSRGPQAGDWPGRLEDLRAFVEGGGVR